MDLIEYTIAYIFTLSLFVFVGLQFDKWVSSNGYSRSTRPAVVIVSVLIVLSRFFVFKTLSWFWFIVIGLTAVTLILHQFDMRETWFRGSWWWVKSKKSRKVKSLTKEE